MFDSIDDLGTKLAATGYFIDPVMTQVVFLAAKLQKPLLLEGPAGSGKTQLAVSVALAARIHNRRDDLIYVSVDRRPCVTSGLYREFHFAHPELLGLSASEAACL
jgi:hypothetical protein